MPGKRLAAWPSTASPKRPGAAAADAVVGVRVRHGGYDWAAGAVDCVITGTAVRVPGAPVAWPVLSDLSGQDYWKLQQAGYCGGRARDGNRGLLLLALGRPQVEPHDERGRKPGAR